MHLRVRQQWNTVHEFINAVLILLCVVARLKADYFWTSTYATIPSLILFSAPSKQNVDVNWEQEF